jgi:hypothetical protein
MMYPENGVAEKQDELKRSFKHTAFFSSLESAMPVPENWTED